MSDVILVVPSTPEAAPGLLRAAARLATLLGSARPKVLAVAEPIHVGALEAEAMFMAADAILAEKRESKARIAALKVVFDDWIMEGGEGASEARWIEAEGSAATIVGERGSRADIIVAGQPAADDWLARQVLRAALFGTDRPVLMVPPGWDEGLGRCVAIAWRDEKQAARAIIPALRCLAGAEQVHVLIGVRERAERPAMPRIFLEHGIHAELHVLSIGSGPLGQMLLDKAHEVGADLLVMGAYAHSPLRELVFGGVTRYMLAHADLPVLMRH
jgi:nucleotide-binding universal stress UspA family protein